MEKGIILGNTCYQLVTVSGSACYNNATFSFPFQHSLLFSYLIQLLKAYILGIHAVSEWMCHVLLV